MTKIFTLAAILTLAGGSLAHANPMSTAIQGAIAAEAAKCAKGAGVPGGCFGPNGEIVKTFRNGVRDITHGPGHSNDLFGRDGWAHRTFGNW